MYNHLLANCHPHPNWPLAVSLNGTCTLPACSPLCSVNLPYKNTPSIPMYNITFSKLRSSGLWCVVLWYDTNVSKYMDSNECLLHKSSTVQGDKVTWGLGHNLATRLYFLKISSYYVSVIIFVTLIDLKTHIAFGPKSIFGSISLCIVIERVVWPAIAPPINLDIAQRYHL